MVRSTTVLFLQAACFAMSMVTNFTREQSLRRPKALCTIRNGKIYQGTIVSSSRQIGLIDDAKLIKVLLNLLQKSC